MALILVGCSGGGSDDGSSSNPDTSSLSVSADSAVLVGGQLSISVSMVQASSGLSLGINSSGEGSVVLEFIDASNAEKFNLSYSSECAQLTSNNTCSIVLELKSSGLALAGSSISYKLVTSLNGREIESSIMSFMYSTPSVETSSIEVGGDSVTPYSHDTSVSTFPDFYLAPQNTKLAHLGIASNEVNGSFVSGNNIYAATLNGLSIAQDISSN